MADTLTETEEREDEGGRRMPDDLRTIGAIIRLLKDHDTQTAADIMDYVSRRAKRAAMIDETLDRR